MKGVKTAFGFVLEVLAVLLFAGALGGCAHGPNPCVGNVDRDSLPCTCPATTNPGCQPWILDAKKHPKEPTK